MAYTTIDKNSDHFNTILRTGNYAGSGTTAITGVGFSPGLMWEKKRNGTSIHSWLDQVRGNGKQLQSETTGAETTTSQYASIDSDGFTVNNSADYGTSSNLVSWHWKANGAGSSNSDGSTTATVSANTTAGFSIVSWTGTGSATTLGHGLGTTPQVILVKNRSEVYGWQMYHPGLGGNNKYISINSSDAVATDTASWNNTAPTSSVFSVGASDANNKNTNNIIAYCYAEKKGYSKFGSYIGNGNANGRFVYTGFKPAFVLIKNITDAGELWEMFDNKRIGYNPKNHRLYASTNDAEDTSAERLDLLSNGFKIRTTGSHVNESGDTMIYMAFAENPIIGSNNIPATAK